MGYKVPLHCKEGKLTTVVGLQGSRSAVYVYMPHTAFHRHSKGLNLSPFLYSDSIRKPYITYTHTLNTVQYIYCTLQITDNIFLLNTVQYKLLTVHCTWYTVQWTLHIEYCTLNSAYCTWYSDLCTLHNTHWKMHTAHFKLHNTHCTLHPLNWAYRQLAPVWNLSGNLPINHSQPI